MVDSARVKAWEYETCVMSCDILCLVTNVAPVKVVMVWWTQLAEAGQPAETADRWRVRSKVPVTKEDAAATGPARICHRAVSRKGASQCARTCLHVMLLFSIMHVK